MISPEQFKVGDIVQTKSNGDGKFEVGNSFFIKDIPFGTKIYNLEINKGFGGKIARAAGNYCTILRKMKSTNKVCIQLPSKEKLVIEDNCIGTIGIVSNISDKLKKNRKSWKC